MIIKTKGNKKVLPLGDFIAGAYRAWGTRRVKGFVRLAFNAGLVGFPGPQRFVISGD